MFTVFDLETTGLMSLQHDVIQFAYIMFDNNRMPVRAESLFFYYDDINWTDEAYNIHHIPKEFLMQYKDQFHDNLIKMYSVLMRSNVIGHNSEAFDVPFARMWLKRQGLGDLEYGNRRDTMRDMKAISKRPKISLMKLAALCGISDEIIQRMTVRYFGENATCHAHDATYDCTATALITLYGMSKGIIDFSNYAVAPVALEVEELSNTEEAQRYGDGIYLTIQMADEPNHYEDKFLEFSSGRLLPGNSAGSGPRLTHPLLQVGDTWSIKAGVLEFILSSNNDFHKLEAKYTPTSPVRDMRDDKNLNVIVEAVNKMLENEY